MQLKVMEKNEPMEISALAGKPAPRNMLVDLALLEREYYERRPDVGDPNQLVSFGTSGHRGSSLRGTFTEAHILAITQAISCRIGVPAVCSRSRRFHEVKRRKTHIPMHHPAQIYEPSWLASVISGTCA